MPAKQLDSQQALANELNMLAMDENPTNPALAAELEERIPSASSNNVINRLERAPGTSSKVLP